MFIKLYFNNINTLEIQIRKTLRKKIYYWSPSIVNIATNSAVINSAFSIKKYSKIFDAEIINFFGEFERFDKNIKSKEIKLINFYNKKLFNYLPRHGKINSRISFILIFLMSFIPLKKILKQDKPEYLIVHLITSLPLILLIMFKFQTKFVLRISGLPRLNIIRKFLWKIALKKIHLITCPTQETYKYIKSLNLCDEKKIKILSDPIIYVKDVKNKLKESIDTSQDFYVAIGRLTRQKNFLFLCKCFNHLVKKNPKLNLFIIGDGENYSLINNYIKKNNLSQNIKLLGYKENIFPYLKKSKGFILSSLWEDPGFVLIEAAFCRVPIYSSDSRPGPLEIIKDNVSGTLFKNNNETSFLKNFEIFLKNSQNKEIILNNLKYTKKFSVFNHYQKLSDYLR